MWSMPKFSSAESAVSRLPEDVDIVAGPGCGTPTSLLRALGEQADRRRAWRLWSGLLLGPLDFTDAVREGRLAYRTWQVTRATRELVTGGAAEYLPLRGSLVPSVLARRGIEAALIRVSPPDRHGYCSLGASVSYPLPIVGLARTVIAEVDETMPRTVGRSAVPVSAFAGVVESADPTPEYRAAPPDSVSRLIAAHVRPLLPEWAIVKLGLGAVPEAVTALLGEADLGPFRFVGMANDWMVPLFDRGVLSIQTVVPRPAVAAVELMGTRMLLDFADGNPAIGVYPVGDAGEPVKLARLDRFVSINSAAQIDLSGQCNAEYVAGRHVGGIGGSVDFVEAARGSDGGVRIVALPATAGAESRIVARLPHDAPVTIPRHSVDYVVTEHGVAALDGLSLDERAAALVAVAAPEHRDGVVEAARAPAGAQFGASQIRAG
jgi:4-hydroxybutyrate CoA-transferase